MNHRTTARFWREYGRLAVEVQELADSCFQLLRQNSRHSSLHLKRVGPYWSARVGLHHRVLAVEDGPNLIWIWIGTHAEYDHLIGRI